MFAKLVSLPFLLPALVFLYLAVYVDGSYAAWLAPFVIITAIIYILAPQINWWWYSRNPPRLSIGLKQTLRRFCGFYQRLDAAGRRKFEGWVGLFQMGTDWTPMGWPDDTMPPDVELAIAAQAVTLTFYRETFLFDEFEKVVVYPRHFPSPEHPYPHSSELYQPDGCLIFSAENLMYAFANPGMMYQVAMHEYAKAYLLKYPDENWPKLDSPDIWEKLQEIGRFTREQVETTVGLAGLDTLPVAIHHYFMFPLQFQKVLPDIFEQLQQAFNPGRS